MLALEALVEPEGKTPGVDYVAGVIEDAEAEVKLPQIEGAVAAPSEGSLQRKYTLRQRSVLEERMLEAARERQRESIVQDQIVWGKKFEGVPFISKPEVIVFDDFEAGGVYTKKFTLTNGSYSFNSFKELEMPKEIRSFVTLTYKMPGRMSAGLSVTLHVKFEPKTNEDIVSVLPFLAQTGKFSVPIRCTPKKAIPQMSAEEVDFGQVILGERRKKHFFVKNAGAIGFKYEIIPVAFTAFDGSGAPTERDPGDAASEVKFLNSSGAVEGYSQQSIPVVYEPAAHGSFTMDCEVVITFSSGDVENTSMPLRVKGTALQVPIFVGSPIVDFRCCMYDKLYRSTFEVKNRGTIAMKVSVPKSVELGDAVAFHPDMGFVQGSKEGNPGSFPIQVKFRPTKAIFEECVRAGFADENTGEISVPVTIKAPDQVLPVVFQLKAKLTTSDIAFDPPEIDFGECYTNQSLVVPKDVEPWFPPPKFGFCRLKPYVSVSPQDGFGTLLPERILCVMLYSIRLGHLRTLFLSCARHLQIVNSPYPVGVSELIVL